MNQQEIWAEWKSGKHEKVDSAESEAEALYLLQEYRIAYGASARSVYMKLSEVKDDTD
jgi:hypothetical protein